MSLTRTGERHACRSWRVANITNKVKDSPISNLLQIRTIVQGDTKKRELLKNPTKIEEIQEKKLLKEIEPLLLAS